MYYAKGNNRIRDKLGGTVISLSGYLYMDGVMKDVDNNFAKCSIIDILCLAILRQNGKVQQIHIKNLVHTLLYV